jgi:RHS repeat-associated protein
LIGTYTAGANWNNTQTQIALSFYSSTQRVYFGKKLVATLDWQGNRVGVAQDRLESVGKYYAFGEERNSPTLANDTVKFASYTRDSATGLDYADQRYYANTFGRFMTADPYKTSAGPSDPQSWNKYAYAEGDPVNFYDPTGLLIAVPGGYIPDWCYEFPGDPGCYDPVPIPQEPTLVRPVRCTISVASKGQPRDGQNLVGLVPYSPQTNTLGNYSTVNQSGYAPSSRGWYFAVQIEASIFEDTDPNDWVATQTVSISGTITIQHLGGPPVTISGTMPVHPDNPETFAVNKATTGRFDWLDAPGLVKYQSAGAIVVGANETDTFTSTLTNTKTGDSCSVSWSLHLTGKGDKWSWSFR